MRSTSLFMAAYAAMVVFMLVVLTSHPNAQPIASNWLSFYIPVAFVFGLVLAYVVYRGVLAAIFGD